MEGLLEREGLLEGLLEREGLPEPEGSIGFGVGSYVKSSSSGGGGPA